LKTYLVTKGALSVKLTFKDTGWTRQGTCVESNTESFLIGRTYSYFTLADMLIKGWDSSEVTQD